MPRPSHASSPYCFNRRKISNAIALAMVLAAEVHAGPTGGNIVGGEGAIHQAGPKTTITQDSDRLAIDWESFNIEADERVQFVQPGQDSLALNRVLGNDASHIFGRLDANGQVILVNPNGVLFGEGASVNVGGLVASGLDIDPSDFMNGELLFDSGRDDQGFVINRGLINAATGGNVALLGKRVVNEGLISAELGSVALAAGREAVLTFDPSGLIGVRVTKAVLQEHLGMDPAVSNSGSIQAAGGRVLLTASASQDVFSQAVNSGELAGDTQVLVHEDGSFTLGKGASLVNTGEVNVSQGETPEQADFDDRAGDVVMLAEDIQQSGTVRADALLGEGGEVVLAASGRTWLKDGSQTTANGMTYGDGKGGTVRLLGKQVGLTGDARVEANGAGEVVIGGKGSTVGSQLKDTRVALVGEDAIVNAGGDYVGGSIKVWSKHHTLVDGRLAASAHTKGEIILASEGTLGFNGEVDLTGVEENGTLTLRGGSLNVTDERSLSSISELALNDALASSSVVMEAAGDIQIGAAGQGVSLQSQEYIDANHLTLSAGGNVTIQDSDISLQQGTLFVTSRANAPADEDAGFTGIAIDNSSIASEWGSAELNSAADIDVTNSTFNAHLTAIAEGDVSLDLTALVPSISVTGEDVSITTYGGFESGKLSARNLSVDASFAVVNAGINVTGTTTLTALESYFGLVGDLNLLAINSDAQSGSSISITESNDLTLGNLNLVSTGLYLELPSDGATVTQAPDTHISLFENSLSLRADNIDLGADGTSSITLWRGRLNLDFAQMLSLNGRLDYSDGDYESNSTLEITGSDSDNRLLIGAAAEFIPSQYALPEDTHIDLGAGDDSVELYAGLPISLALGEGINSVLADGLLAQQAIHTTEISGDTVEITTYGTFHAGLVRANEFMLDAVSSNVNARAEVTGNTALLAAGEADVNLTGDFNTLTASGDSGGYMTVTDDNDLVFGEMNFVEADLDIFAPSEGATVSQAANTSALVGIGGLVIDADNIHLGAGGSSSISGNLDLTFDKVLSLEGPISYWQFFDVTGSDSANTLTVGEFARVVSGVPASLDDGSAVELGAGDDTVNLFADLPMAIDFGTGDGTLLADGFVARQAIDTTEITGENLNITSYGGFLADLIRANNLELDATDSDVSARAEVSGSTALQALGGANIELAGDFNTLTATGGSDGYMTVVDDNDLMFGAMDLEEADVDIVALGEGATVSQMANTEANVGIGGLEIVADNIALGAGGTSSIVGNLTLVFDQVLNLEGGIHYSGYDTRLTIHGSDGANTFNVGEQARITSQERFAEFDSSSVQLQLGDDTVNLASNFTVPLALGGGADVINLLAPDVEANPTDFDPSEDTLNAYSP